MKTLLTLIALQLSCYLYSQTSTENLDKVYFHNGEISNVDVKKVGEFVIEYSYPGEATELMLSKRAVQRIVFRSGREQKITDMITISGEQDWEKVDLVYNTEEVAGLKEVGDVLGKTKGAFSAYTSGAGSDRRANEKLLTEAAKLKCPFVLLVDDKDAKGGAQRGSYGNQSLKKGIAYSY